MTVARGLRNVALSALSIVIGGGRRECRTEEEIPENARRNSICQVPIGKDIMPDNLIKSDILFGFGTCHCDAARWTLPTTSARNGPRP